MKTFREYITEMVYQGNIGMMEMISFFQKASKPDITKMEKAIKEEDWDVYKKLIKKVLGVSLK